MVSSGKKTPSHWNYSDAPSNWKLPSLIVPCWNEQDLTRVLVPKQSTVWEKLSDSVLTWHLLMWKCLSGCVRYNHDALHVCDRLLELGMVMNNSIPKSVCCEQFISMTPTLLCLVAIVLKCLNFLLLVFCWLPILLTMVILYTWELPFTVTVTYQC